MYRIEYSDEVKKNTDQTEWKRVGFFGDLIIEASGRYRRLVDDDGIVFLR